jgi:4-hydroxy-2-oxoheptanedioate aldolase
MGMSFGLADNHDEPFPAVMEDARSRILAACKANDIKFLNSVYERDVTMRIDEGVMICAGRDGEAAAKIGRAHTKRAMPV